MNELEGAIHKSAHAFGVNKLAKMMALNEQSLRNKLCPTNTVAKLSITEFDAICAITEDLTPMHVLANSHGCALVLSDSKPQAVERSLMVVVAEVGDVARVIPHVLEDDYLSPREGESALKEIQEAILSLEVLKMSVKNRIGKRV